jgi:hypothetical protein
MNFYVCYCGNTENNHNFRHSFQSTALVKKTRNGFVLDSKSFPSFLERKKCIVEQCGASMLLHDGEIIKHEFKPSDYTYRKIVFVLPDDTICNVCRNILSNHSSETTHYFTTKIELENRNPKDRVSILHPEDDEIVVVWNS